MAELNQEELNGELGGEDSGITSSINLEDGKKVTDEETPNESEQEEKEGEEKDKADDDTEEEDDSESDSDKEDDEEEDKEIDYKAKFSASTREYQRLAIKLKEGEVLTKKEKDRADKLEQDLKELSEKMKAEKPELYDSVTLKKALDKTSLELAELKEKSLLDDFVRENPIAKGYREALKAHARAFPSKSLEDIWNDSFKEVAENKAVLDEKKKETKKKTASEKGDGGKTKEPKSGTIAGYSVEEFNKLPVAKRRQLAIENGISF